MSEVTPFKGDAVAVRRPHIISSGLFTATMAIISACCPLWLPYGTNLCGPVCLGLVCCSPTHCRGTFLKPRPLACSKCAGGETRTLPSGLAKCKTKYFFFLYWSLASSVTSVLTPSKPQCSRSVVQFLRLFTTYYDILSINIFQSTD